MKRLVALVVLCLAWVPLVYGLTINGIAPGSVATMSAVAIGTTPAAVATCSTSTTCRRKAIEFDVITSGSNCYFAPAPQSSPCGVASPAPNISTKAGKWILGPGSWVYRADKDVNPADSNICAEWDATCDAASSVSHIDLP